MKQYFSFAAGITRDQQHPILIPGQTLRMLAEDQPDWTSQNWTELFIPCTRQA